MVALNSAKSVEAIKEVGYHTCAKGLYLQVSKQGTKSWLFRYTSPITKKRREMGLGSLDFVSLAEARQLAVDNKRLVISGKDPIEERKQSQIIKISVANGTLPNIGRSVDRTNVVLRQPQENSGTPEARSVPSFSEK
jgi:hypothetical protein